MTDAIWQTQVEQAERDYLSTGDEAAFRAALKRLGFEVDEVESHVAAAKDGRQ